MEISIENLSVEAFTYRRSWRARRARRSLKNKLNQLVFMQFNFIPSGSLVRFSLAFFQSRLYPDKLERCDVTKIQICTKSFQNLALFVY